MSDSIRSFRLGTARVSIITVGDVEAPLTTWMDPPAGGWPPDIAPLVTQRQRVSQNCVFVQLGAVSVLVDASRFVPGAEPAISIPNYVSPPDLIAALASLGVQPEQVTDIVLTHVHRDHIDGLTMTREGAEVPAFPKARCHLGQADWDRPETQKALADRASLESRTLGLLQQAGLLELTSGRKLLGAGVEIIPAPGETPGHQLLRIASGGEILYCAGDLIHAPFEVEKIEFAVPWAEPRSMLASRQSLFERAAAEDAIVVATHIPAPGRLRRENGGFMWIDAGSLSSG